MSASTADLKPPMHFATFVSSQISNASAASDTRLYTRNANARQITSYFSVFIGKDN